MRGGVLSMGARRSIASPIVTRVPFVQAALEVPPRTPPRRRDASRRDARCPRMPRCVIGVYLEYCERASSAHEITSEGGGAGVRGVAVGASAPASALLVT